MSWSHSSIHTQAQSLIKGGSETSEILKLNFKSHCTSVAELQLNENHNDLDLSSFTDQVSKFLCDHHLAWSKSYCLALSTALAGTMENVKGSRSPNVLVTLPVNTPIKLLSHFAA